MRRIIVIFILLLLVPITKVEGARCSYSEIARLKKIASNVNVSYDYTESDSSVTFQITLNNLNEDIYFVDQSNYRQYKYSTDELTLSNYQSGQTIRYVFYATDPNCDDEPLYTARVVLPVYNQYYNDPVCNDVRDYSLCQKWSSHNLSYDEFVKKVNDYKNSLIVPEQPEEPPVADEVTITQLIVNFLLDYYIYIIAILSLALIVFFTIRKKDDIYS